MQFCTFFLLYFVYVAILCYLILVSKDKYLNFQNEKKKVEVFLFNNRK